MNSDIIPQLQAEAAKIEEFAMVAAEAHFRSAARWGRTHIGAGVPSTVISAMAGGAAFNEYSLVATGMAISATVLTGLLTFLKPSERAEKHKVVATRYKELANRARVFRRIDSLSMTPEEARKELLKLEKILNELDAAAPILLKSTPAYDLSDKVGNDTTEAYDLSAKVDLDLGTVGGDQRAGRRATAGEQTG